jgi:hypothetical protein
MSPANVLCPWDNEHALRVTGPTANRSGIGSDMAQAAVGSRAAGRLAVGQGFGVAAAIQHVSQGAIDAPGEQSHDSECFTSPRKVLTVVSA